MLRVLQNLFRGASFAASGIAIILIVLYRYCVSPLMPQACRFQVTCSEYAIVSLKKHGAIVGLWKILKRLCRCHPFASCSEE